jgi:hypothetical protein
MLTLYVAYTAWLAYSAAVIGVPPGRGSLVAFLASLAGAILLLALTRWRRQPWGKPLN